MIRRPFTLLEILVVFLVLSLGISLTAVKVRALYLEQRFLSESRQVLGQLVMAQDLMLIMDTDVFVKFSSTPGHGNFTLQLEVDKPMTEQWTRLIERKIELSAIQAVEFDHQKRTELILQFSLGNMSVGKLTLFEARKGRDSHDGLGKFEIDLVGYPSPIGTSGASMDARDRTVKSGHLYPYDVHEELYEKKIQKNGKK